MSFTNEFAIDTNWKEIKRSGLKIASETIFEKKVVSANAMVTQYFL